MKLIEVIRTGKIHKGPGQWYKYFTPVWMNCITWKLGDPKIYKWLFWVFEEK